MNFLKITDVCGNINYLKVSAVRNIFVDHARCIDEGSCRFHLHCKGKGDCRKYAYYRVIIIYDGYSDYYDNTLSLNGGPTRRTAEDLANKILHAIAALTGTVNVKEVEE